MIHVITAFTRKENKELMINHLEGKNIKWTVIIGEDIKFPEWVNIFNVDVSSEVKYCYTRFNDYLDNIEIEDDTYYMFLNDDDFVEEGFWEKIPENYDIVFVSMKRGNNTVRPPHPTFTLFANRENIKVGCVGLEQFIVKGKILKKYRFDTDTGVADGLLAEKLALNDNILYLPDAFVYFNYLEDGRWDEFKR